MHLEPGEYFWQGNEACVHGALVAGCKLFAGYPITPATEISELMANLLPKAGGVFVQGEDELASLAIVIGASNAGWKAMTATSGPGISLMQENIGYACLTQTPCVIVDCQRVGTGTGIATKSMQGDVYQVRFGSHGDYSIIALAPSSPQEMFDLTIKAFNLSEQYRVPVFVLSDEIISHMRENVSVPPEDEIVVVDRKRPGPPTEDFLPYKVESELDVPPMPAFGQGYRLAVSGMVYKDSGAPTTDYKLTEKLMRRLWLKVEGRASEIAMVERHLTEDARVGVVAYGSVARSARRAVDSLREQGYPAGLLRLITLWPFPDEAVRQLAERADAIVVPEMNMGKIVREVERAAGGRAKVTSCPKPGVELHAPEEIEEAVKKVMG